jgi:tRNA(fMet)-specific endonuclease VapC
VAQDEAVRKAREAQLEAVEEAFDPLPFDGDAASAFGNVSASLRDGGAKTRARSFDALIAATALANGMPLYTCNPGHFRNIDDLEVVEVPGPTRLMG